MTDSEYRKYIIEHLDSNIFVLAGAGSGKTTILVDRMVALVEQKEDIISKICAITFTKNAATHFLSKFEQKLRERSKMNVEEWERDKTTNLPMPTELSKERCKKALENINQCFAGTIDSFCNLIISEHPLDANVPSRAKVIEESEFIDIYKNEYKLISDGVFPYQDLKIKLKEFQRLYSNPQDVFSRTIFDIMEAEALDVSFEMPTISLDEAFNEFKMKYQNQLLEDIKYIIHHEDDLDFIADGLEKYRHFKDTYQYKKDFKIKDIQNLKSLVSKIKSIRFINDPEFNILPYSFMKRNKIYKIDEALSKEETSPYYQMNKDISDISYTYSMSFLLDAAKAIRKKLKEEGKLSFTDYLLCFKEMLLKDMENPKMPLIHHIRDRHSIFLLDESQDTSPIQTDVFMLLTSSVQAFKKHDCKPIPGSLFIVGDPKQSIYRFKGADIEAYNDTKEMFHENDSINSLALLSKNFRSTNLLCEFFNDSFKDTLPFFYEIPKKDEVKIEDKITTGIYSYKDYISVIKNLVQPNSKYKIPYKDSYRNIEFRDIMLITRTTFKHQQIMEELKNEGIPVYTEGKFYIKGNEALESLYAIYAYIAKDSMEYRLNLLASPLFQLKDGNLKADISSSLLSLIDEIKQNRMNYNPVSLYTLIIEKTKLFLYVSKDNMEYVYFVLEKLKEAYSNGEISDYTSGEEFLSNFISKIIERCPTLSLEPNAIHLANLHKVKGLEARVVILDEAKSKVKKVSMHQDFIQGKSYIIRSGEKNIGGATFFDFETKNFKEQEEMENRLLEEELTRLKYVAVTRAMNFLFIPEKKDLWDGLNANEEFLEEEVTTEEKVIQESKVNLIDDKFNDGPTYKIKRPSDDHLNIEVPQESKIVNKEISAKDKGTLIHKMMELFVRSHFKYERKDLIMATLASEGFSGKELYNMLDDVYDSLVNQGGYKQYQDKFPKDIISILKDADELHPEYPFSYMEDNNIIYGLIDLLYVKDNKVYIIDYKTNFEPEGYQGQLDWEEVYKGQLESYKEAIEKLYHLDTEAHIYHIG